MGYVFAKPWQDYAHDRKDYSRGESVPETGVKLDWLIRCGIVVDENVFVEAEPTKEPVTEKQVVTEFVDSAKHTRAEVKRPYKTAKLSVWQDYARSQGLDTKNMTREQIIAHFI